MYTSLKWRNIGPQLAGRSVEVTGVPGQPNVYYSGQAGGGLWKTTDAGQTWAPVTDGQISSQSIGAVAVCQANPNVVYIGGGDTDPHGDMMAGDGVYKSTDAGKTWHHLGLTDTQMIGRIVVDPANCDRVYVAALGHLFGTNNQRGVFRSTDGGGTWQKVLYVNAQTGAVDMSMDPSNPDVLYASTWQAYRKFWTMQDGGPGSGLYKSTDGGSTWTNLTSRFGLPAGAPVGKVGVSVSPADPNRVYALVEARAGGLFRSDDAGATWQLVNTRAAIRQRAFYYSRVFADPINPNRVYATNVSFLRSDDGGATFSTTLRPPHGDNHFLWIDPANAQLLRKLTPQTTPADVAGFHQIVPPETPIPPATQPPAVVPPTVPAPPAQNNLATLNDPNDVVRSVSPNATVSYTFKQKVDSAVMQFVAPDGTVAATNTLPTTAGNATTTWNLRYPDAVSFPGLIYWAASNQGPLAPLGAYTVRLVVNGQPLQQSFNILKDYRLTHVTTADIQAEFQLDLAVRNVTSDANQDVINIRACTAQVDDRVKAANDPSVTQAGTSLDNKLNNVQNALYQTKLGASEDPLNYGIALDNRIASLHSVIESVDGRPTDQTSQVFDGLNAQLQTQLKNLSTDVSTDVPSFNQLIQQHGLAPVSCTAV